MPREIPIHTRIAGRYEVVDRLPDGPLGTRWRAIDSRGPELRLTWLPGATWRADVAARLTRFGHVGAVTVRDAGAHDGGVYVVALPPTGRSLRDFLGDLAAPLPLRDARALVDQVAQTLVAAHRGVDGVALVHGVALTECVWIETRGESRHVTIVDDLALASFTDVAGSVGGDVASLGDVLALCLLGETPRESDLDLVARRVRPEVHDSVWAVVRACRAARAADALSAQRVRELLRTADWTPQEVVRPLRETPSESASLPQFERAPPSIAPPVAQPVAPSIAAPVAPSIAAPVALHADPPSAPSIPAPAPAPAVAPATPPVVGRAQFGRRLGILSAGPRRPAPLRVGEETSLVVALPSEALAADASDTLKSPRRESPRRRATVEASMASLDAGAATVPIAARGDGRYETFKPQRVSDPGAATHANALSGDTVALRVSRPSVPSAHDAAAFSAAAMAPSRMSAPPNAWAGETVALDVTHETARHSLYGGAGLGPPPSIAPAPPPASRGRAVAVALAAVLVALAVVALVLR